MNVSTTELAIRNSEENRASAHTLPEHRYPGDAAPGINHARHSLSMIATGYHQLNTAMHCIAGFTQLLLEDHYSSCDRIHEFLEIVHEQSQHLMDIIKSILDIASMSSDQTTFRWQIIPTLEIVKSAAMESQGIAEAKGIALKTALPENLPDIIADKEKLRQAIKNILVTAVTFSSHSSSIDVTARQEGQGLLVEIQGGHMHIPLEITSLINGAQPRSTSSIIVENSDTCLRLYLSKLVIEMHGGRLVAEDQRDENLTIYIAVPDKCNSLLDSIFGSDSLPQQAMGDALSGANTDVELRSKQASDMHCKKSVCIQHPGNTVDKSLHIQLNESEWNTIAGISSHLGVASDMLARLFLKQVLSRCSPGNSLGDPFLSIGQMQTSLPISRREMQMLNLMAKGLSYKEIGGIAYTEEKAVKKLRYFNHVQAGAHNRTHAVVVALKHSLVDVNNANSGKT